jgi:hypothetical protein
LIKGCKLSVLLPFENLMRVGDIFHVIAAYAPVPHEYKFEWWIDHYALKAFAPHVNQHHG